ncbi:hypothetical protein MMYC01_205642, partial [Madurella mycetomatis]
MPPGNNPKENPTRRAESLREYLAALRLDSAAPTARDADSPATAHPLPQYDGNSPSDPNGSCTHCRRQTKPSPPKASGLLFKRTGGIGMQPQHQTWQGLGQEEAVEEGEGEGRDDGRGDDYEQQALPPPVPSFPSLNPPVCPRLGLAATTRPFGRSATPGRAGDSVGQVIYSFTAEAPNELTVRAGDFVTVLQR